MSLPLTAPNGELINGVREIAVTLEEITNAEGESGVLTSEMGETPTTKLLSARGPIGMASHTSKKDMAARVWLDEEGNFWLYEDLVPLFEADEDDEATIEDAAHRAAVHVCRGHLLHARDMARQGCGADFALALDHIKKALEALEKPVA